MSAVPRVLFLLLAVVLLAAEAPVVHYHADHDDGAALFNAVCSLDRLALGATALGVDPPPDLDLRLDAAERVVGRVSGAPRTAPLRRFGARAPPTS